MAKKENKGGALARANAKGGAKPPVNKNKLFIIAAIVTTLIVVLTVVLTAVLSSNNEPEDGATLDSIKDYGGQLIFVMSDGTEVNAGTLPSNHEGIRIISAKKTGTVSAGSSGHTEGIQIVCRGSDNADYTLNWNIPKFGEDCSLKSAYIDSDGILIFNVKENGEYKSITQGKLLKLSTPERELVPSGASEYAKGDLPSDYAEVEIKVKGYGIITVLVDKTAAPATAQKFLELCEAKYYNGLTFNKIFDKDAYGDKVSYILGGLAGGTTTEILDREYSSGISHKYGTISMYHKDGQNATSSFFICTGDNSAELDGKYASFGYVTSGMNIVEEIVKLTGTFSEGEGVLGSELATYRAKQAVIESITVK